MMTIIVIIMVVMMMMIIVKMIMISMKQTILGTMTEDDGNDVSDNGDAPDSLL